MGTAAGAGHMVTPSRGDVNPRADGTHPPSTVQRWRTGCPPRTHNPGSLGSTPRPATAHNEPESRHEPARPAPVFPGGGPYPYPVHYPQPHRTHLASWWALYIGGALFLAALIALIPVSMMTTRVVAHEDTAWTHECVVDDAGHVLAIPAAKGTVYLCLDPTGRLVGQRVD